MAGETTITVIGNLTDDPELRFTPSGDGVANFSVASTPRRMNRQTGEWEDGEPMFLRCSVWRDHAEHVAESLKRGYRVIVVGNLRQRSYEKDGQKRTTYELDVQEIGPALRYATATVSKSSSGGDRAGGFGQRSGPSQDFQDPWKGKTGGGRSEARSSAFDDEPPF